ncbi:MAG: hypothetical protein GY708_13475 [Actinomycetia bacterium]|nr:hypothetical protein [Actinomycetes bacterium]
MEPDDVNGGIDDVPRQERFSSPATVAAVTATATFITAFTLGAARPLTDSSNVMLITLLILAIVGAGLWVWFRATPRRQTFAHGIAVLHLQTIWAAALLAAILTVIRGPSILLAFAFVASGLPLLGLAAVAGPAFGKWKQGLAGAVLMFGAAAAAVGFYAQGLYDDWFPALARVQVAVASDLTDDPASADLVYEGVAVWVFHHGEILDGGSGVAFDPSHRMSDPDFADEVWFAATYDPTECRLLVDDWYWCW